jgi:predicted Zn-ribbon and HTH transcriptional regulator
MPLIATIKCNQCDLQLPTGAGGYLYALNSAGERIVCPHPMEMKTVQRVTGLDWHGARTRGFLGHVSYCLCFTCTHQFELDVERDPKQCPECKSLEVRTANASLGAQCPRCHKETLVEEALGIS